MYGRVYIICDIYFDTKQKKQTNQKRSETADIGIVCKYLTRKSIFQRLNKKITKI